MGKGAEEGGSTGGIPARGEKKINESSWKVQWGGEHEQHLWEADG